MHELKLLNSHPLLQGIHAESTLEELEAIACYEEGQSYKVQLNRGPFGVVEFYAKKNVRIFQLFKMIKVAIGRVENRPINWY